MKRFYNLMLLVVFLSALGCQPEAIKPPGTIAGNMQGSSDSSSLDFDAMLNSVDSEIGKRFQAMQMEAMNSASYQYDGPIKKVVDIIEPIALATGFMEQKDRPAIGAGEAEKEMQSKMGMSMSAGEQKMYVHPNGDTLMIIRMDVANKDIDMKMLMVQLMNPKKMSDFGAKAKKL